MAPKVETCNLTRTVNDVRIVDSVSVAIYESETFVIIGPSGSGKSSFLRLLNRLDEPTAGMVLLDGEDYRTLPPRQLRMRVSLVPQDFALVPGTVLQNIARGPKLRGEPVDVEHVKWLLERLRLTGYEERDVKDLSGGEKQRISIARTLLNEPEVLLLDEPTSHLDSATERGVERMLKDLAAELELTNVVVTHDAAQARRIGDRAMLLHNGRLERVGPVDEVM